MISSVRELDIVNARARHAVWVGVVKPRFATEDDDLQVAYLGMYISPVGTSAASTAQSPTVGFYRCSVQVGWSTRRRIRHSQMASSPTSHSLRTLSRAERGNTDSAVDLTVFGADDLETEESHRLDRFVCLIAKSHLRRRCIKDPTRAARRSV